MEGKNKLADLRLFISFLVLRINKYIMIKRKHLLTCCLSVSILTGYTQKTYVMRETDPAKGHYRTT